MLTFLPLCSNDSFLCSTSRPKSRFIYTMCAFLFDWLFLPVLETLDFRSTLFSDPKRPSKSLSKQVKPSCICDWIDSMTLCIVQRSGPIGSQPVRRFFNKMVCPSLPYPFIGECSSKSCPTDAIHMLPEPPVTEGESMWSDFDGVINDNINFCWKKPSFQCIGLTLWHPSIGKLAKGRGWQFDSFSSLCKVFSLNLQIFCRPAFALPGPFPFSWRCAATARVYKASMTFHTIWAFLVSDLAPPTIVLVMRIELFVTKTFFRHNYCFGSVTWILWHLFPNMVRIWAISTDWSRSLNPQHYTSHLAEVYYFRSCYRVFQHKNDIFGLWMQPSFCCRNSQISEVLTNAHHAFLQCDKSSTKVIEYIGIRYTYWLPKTIWQKNQNCTSFIRHVSLTQGVPLTHWRL